MHNLSLGGSYYFLSLFKQSLFRDLCHLGFAYLLLRNMDLFLDFMRNPYRYPYKFTYMVRPIYIALVFLVSIGYVW